MPDTVGDGATFKHLYPDVWAAFRKRYGRREIPSDIWTMFQDLQLLKFARTPEEIDNVIWGLWSFSKAATSKEGMRASHIAKVFAQELTAREHEKWFMITKQTGELERILARHPNPEAVMRLGDQAARTAIAVSVILEDVRRRWEVLLPWQRDVMYRYLNEFLDAKMREANLIVDVLEPRTFTFLFIIQLVRAGHKDLALNVFKATPKKELLKTLEFGHPVKTHSYFELHTRFMTHGGEREATKLLEHLVEINAYSDDALDIFVHNVELKDALLFIIDVVSCIRKRHGSRYDRRALIEAINAEVAAAERAEDTISKYNRMLMIEAANAGPEGVPLTEDHGQGSEAMAMGGGLGAAQHYSHPRRSTVIGKCCRWLGCVGIGRKKSMAAGRLMWAGGVPHELLWELLNMYANRDPSAQDYLLRQKDFQMAIETVFLLSEVKLLTRFVERLADWEQDSLIQCLKEWSKTHLVRILQHNRQTYNAADAADIVTGKDQWTWIPSVGRMHYFYSDVRTSKDLAMILSSFWGLCQFLDVSIIGQFLTFAETREVPLMILNDFIPVDTHLFLTVAREIGIRLSNLFFPEVKLLMRIPGFYDDGVQEFCKSHAIEESRETFREPMSFAVLMQAISRLVGFHGGDVGVEKIESSVYTIGTACQGNPFCQKLTLRMMGALLKKPALSFLSPGATDAGAEPSALTVSGLSACARRLRESCDTVRTDSVRQTLTRLVDAFLDTPPRGWVGQFNALEVVLFFLRLKEKENLELAYEQFEAENRENFEEDPEMMELLQAVKDHFSVPFMDVKNVPDLCSMDVRAVLAKHKRRDANGVINNVTGGIGGDIMDLIAIQEALGGAKPEDVLVEMEKQHEIERQKMAEMRERQEREILEQAREMGVEKLELTTPRPGAGDRAGGVGNDVIKQQPLPREAEHPGVPGAGDFGHFQPATAQNKKHAIPHGGFGASDWNLVVEIATCTAESMKEKCNVPMLPHHTQMVTLLMFATQVCRGPGKPKESVSGVPVLADAPRTILAKVGTGEGKSWLIGMLASFVAKKGLRAHVVVDNATLLERDYASMAGLFKRLGLSSGKREFGKGHDIIYCSGMDLESDYMERMKQGVDSSFKKCVMIVDEVDSLIVDDSVYKCYVEEYKDGSDVCQQWCNEGRQGFQGAERWCKKILDRLDSAHAEMRGKREGKDFAIDSNQGWIWALDDKTSMVMRSAWFLWLELKRKQTMQQYQIRYMTRQSVVCKRSCFSSHTFIFGLTGSLGTEAEMRYTKANFGASFFHVPPFLNTCTGERVSKAKCVGTKVLENPEQQKDATIECARSYVFSVPVLVVCRDADHVEQRVLALREALPSHAEGDRNGPGIVSLVDKPGKEAEFQEQVELATRQLEVPAPDGGKPLLYWRITVTTPVGARGQDYRISDDMVDEKGGLLLILEFIPHSEREWIQFLGRTARHDHPGQYAVFLNLEEYRTVLGSNNEAEGGVVTRILDHVNKEGEKKLQALQQDVVKGSLMHKFTANWWRWSENHQVDQATKREKFDRWVSMCEEFESQRPDQIVKNWSELEIEVTPEVSELDPDEDFEAVEFEEEEEEDEEYYPQNMNTVIPQQQQPQPQRQQPGTDAWSFGSLFNQFGVANGAGAGGAAAAAMAQAKGKGKGAGEADGKGMGKAQAKAKAQAQAAIAARAAALQARAADGAGAPRQESFGTGGPGAAASANVGMASM